MPLSLPVAIPSLFSLLGGGEESGPGAMSFVLSSPMSSLQLSTTASSSTSSASSNPNTKKRKPCGRHGPLGRRGGPFFPPDFFSASPENENESLLTMVAVGGGSPEEADRASFPLALPRENGAAAAAGRQELAPPSSSSSPSPPSGSPFEVLSSLVRALESAANGGDGRGAIGPQSFLLSTVVDSEGRDAPLAEKKKTLDDDDEEEEEEEEQEDDDEDEEEEGSMEQQQQQEEGENESGGDDLPEEESAWVSSFAAENAGDNERALLQDELSRRLPPSFSLASFFVDDRYLGMLGFALLCAASGAAWVATVSVARRIRGGGEGADDDDDASSSLLEPLAGGAKEPKGATTIENPLYYGVVSAADFVEK